MWKLIDKSWMFSVFRLKTVYTSILLGYNIIKVLFIGRISMEKVNEQENLYEQFLKYSYMNLNELFKKAKTKEL